MAPLLAGTLEAERAARLVPLGRGGGRALPPRPAAPRLPGPDPREGVKGRVGGLQRRGEVGGGQRRGPGGGGGASARQPLPH